MIAYKTTISNKHEVGVTYGKLSGEGWRFFKTKKEAELFVRMTQFIYWKRLQPHNWKILKCEVNRVGSTSYRYWAMSGECLTAKEFKILKSIKSLES